MGLFWPAALTAKKDFVAGGVHDGHYYCRVGARELGVLEGVYGKGKEGGGKYCDIVDAFFGRCRVIVRMVGLGDSFGMPCQCVGKRVWCTGMDGDSAGATGSVELWML